MRDQLEALGDLARIDLGGRRLEVELEEIRTRLTQLDGELDRMRELLAREQNAIVETEALGKKTNDETLDLAERITRSTQRHNNAKTPRERDATARELEVLRQEKDERTARKAELETALVQMKESAARHEKDFEALQVALASERTESEARVVAIETLRKEQSGERESTAKRVRADLLRRYNSVRERRGTAVADAVEGVCRGCNISLPPQFNARLMAQREILQCPNCLRILLFRPNTTGAST